MTRFNRTLPLVGLLIAALCALAAPASATVVKSLSFEEMTRTADVVIRGEVISRNAAWNEAGSRIYTVTEIRITEAFKGIAIPGTDSKIPDSKTPEGKPAQATAPKTLTIRQLGGTADGITQHIAGNAEMEVGEEVVLFLRKDKDPTSPLHFVVGMAQGKFTVDRSGPTTRIARSLKDLAFATVEAGKVTGLVEKPTTPIADVPDLATFRARIKAVLAH